jgi:hypothetical protein
MDDSARTAGVFFMARHGFFPTPGEPEMRAGFGILLYLEIAF